ncbi:MAG: ATP-binding protein [Bacteroidota bacterium]|nr:ATP-binding protein [Bacteroidota bacterium]
MSRIFSFIKKLSFASWTAILLLFAFAIGIDFFNKVEPKDYALKLEKTLHKKEIEASKTLNEYYSFLKTRTPKDLFEKQKNSDKDLFRKKGIVYLAYQNDSLLYWSDNSASVEEYMKEVCLDNPLAKLKNGYFEVIKQPNEAQDKYRLLALILIKNEYSYQNKYLQNNFFKDYDLPKGTVMFENGGKNDVLVKNHSGENLFYLSFQSNESSKSNWWLYISISLYGLGFVFSILLIKKEYFKLTEAYSKNGILIFYFLTLIAIRAIMILNKLPGALYETQLYNPAVFGNAESFWFGFLGDVIINVLLLFFTSVLVQQRISFKRLKTTPAIVFLVVSVIVLLCFGNLINNVINSLVENSNISFRVNDLFTLDTFSFVAFGIVALFFFSFYLIADKLIEEFLKQKLAWWIYVLLLAVALPLQWYLNDKDPTRVVWPFIVISIILLFKWRKTTYSFSYGIVFIVVFSFITSQLFFKNETTKEIETRKIYAQRLADQQDAVAENLFIDISKNIKNDTKLKALIFKNPVVSLDVEQRLRQVYLGGYWERYNIGVSLFDSICRPLILTQNPYYENNSYFDEQINLSGTETVCPDLYYIQNMNDRLRYVAKIPLFSGNKVIEKPAFLYFEIEPKVSPDIVGFPELLLDKSVKTNSLLSNYSFAIYKNGQMVQRSGKYPYNFKYSWAKSSNDFSQLTENNYLHLIYKADNLTQVVISKENINIWARFTTNSYFFMFFSLLLWLFLYMREWRARKKSMESSLNLRIQLLLVSVVLVCLFAFGIGTFVFINKQFEEKNTAALDEKIKSVLQELQAKLGEQESLPENFKEYTGYIVKKLSVVFASDITVFDLKGNMFASSQPRLFNEGIISKKMNPQAFDHILSSRFINVVLKENVGNLNYYSAYQPFYNKNGQLLAYVNLPYFAKQNELEKEISIYIVALINIYVILFAFSTIAALFISNLVTKPLRMIQQRLSNVRLGKRNEPILWAEKDEIGKLVNEYNRMIEQLEASADKLAKSERESAWREMAKQVAHEIKNPLTPMKLSVQHLQRTINSDSGDMKERIEKLSVMLIEQIDTLSNIAGEFSSFAKMPTANIELLCINELLKNSVELFKESENIDLHYLDKTNGMQYVKVDKNQCSRIFTNLIKNAQQAIPAGRVGKIEIDLFVKNKNVVVKVKDNGTGIAPEAMDKIFAPNFSTKTEGMGLGLAMVKNSVESFGGTIWFETGQNTGTSFYVSLPISK